MTSDIHTALGIAPDRVTNPYDVPAELDQVRPIATGVAGYSETIALSTWNPADEVGIFVHAGRCRQDLELWWAQVAVYLHGGLVAVDRSWGRCPDGLGIRTGNLDLRMEGSNRGWSATFDGAAEIVPWTNLLSRPTGSGAGRPVRWDLRTTPAGPIWDMYAAIGHGGEQTFASSMHLQQVLSVEGSLTVDGQQYRLDGVGWKDHSAGKRSMSVFGRDHFLGGSLPGRGLHCLSVFGLDGTPLMEAGTMFSIDGGVHGAVLVDVPLLRDLDDVEEEFEAGLLDTDGTRSTIRVEVLNNFPMVISDDNDNINGIEWEGPDLLVLLESRVKITTSGGAVGYAHLERGARRNMLTFEPRNGHDGTAANSEAS